MFRTILLSMLAAFFLLSGCGKEKEIKEKNEKAVQQEMDNNDTSSLTPSESFGAMLTQNILNDETEVDLEIYLSESVFPKLKDAAKVTIDKVSSSLYLLTYYDASGEKNMLIRKYYNPRSDEITFEISETGPNAAKQFLK